MKLTMPFPKKYVPADETSSLSELDHRLNRKVQALKEVERELSTLALNLKNAQEAFDICRGDYEVTCTHTQTDACMNECIAPKCV